MSEIITPPLSDLEIVSEAYAQAQATIESLRNRLLGSKALLEATEQRLERTEKELADLRTTPSPVIASLTEEVERLMKENITLKDQHADVALENARLMARITELDSSESSQIDAAENAVMPEPPMTVYTAPVKRGPGRPPKSV